MSPAPRTLRVRMYAVGFGDCFLVSLPVRDKTAHVLVDFGVHPRGDLKVMDEVLADIETETKGRLALVVASHEHADHIAGYGRFEDQLSRFDIGEVWMPWAMDPKDRTAAGIRRQQLALAGQVGAHLCAVAPKGTDYTMSPAMAAVMNLTQNQKAVAALRSGFRGAARKVRYLKAGKRVRVPAELEGVDIRVLGPPGDGAYLRKMDPPGHERYLRASAASDASGKKPDTVAQPVNALLPFPKRWRLDRATARAAYGVTEKDEADLRQSLQGAPDNVAFALDWAMNNTSLVLLIACGGRSLLFPGDAQYGSWRSWLDDPTTAALLDDVSFLKVSHHGSVNATPRSALEGLPDKRFAAMVSTQTSPWPSIPRVPLMQRLRERSGERLVRSDDFDPDGAALAAGAPLPENFSRNASPPSFDWTVEI